MAEMTYQATGELQAGTRALAALCGVSQPTVTATLRALQMSGVIECAERGIGTRPTRWRWTLAPPSPASAEPGDNPVQRATSKALADSEKSAKPVQRANSKALARKMGTQLPGSGIYQGTDADDVDPAAVAANVAALREHLPGHRGVGQPSSHNGDAPSRVPDTGDALCAPDALLQRPDIGAEYGPDPADVRVCPRGDPRGDDGWAP